MKRKKSEPAGVYDNSEEVKKAPPSSVAPGQEVIVTHGEVPDHDCGTTERSADGIRGRALGSAYEQTKGPNAGAVMQPIREHGTGATLAVPVDRLSKSTPGKSRRSFGFSHISQDAWDAAFGK